MALTKASFSMITGTPVNVKDFGAVGNGIADDFLAINRAVKFVADQGGGTVYYPPGTYRITRSIRLDDFNVETNTYSGNVRRDVVHQGAGRDATTILADGFYACIFSSFPEPFIQNSEVSPSPVPGNLMASGVVIQDMTLDCNYDNVVDGGAAYGANYQTSPPAVGGWPNGYVGPSYWAADNYQYPIYFYYAEGLQVTNCRVKNSWYNGIEIYASARVQITDNFIENCGDKANFLGYYSAVQFDQRSNTGLVANNIIQDCGFGIQSVSGAGATSAVLDITISDNIFYNITYGSGIYATDFVQRWSVTGNTFDEIERSAIQFVNNQPGWPSTDLPKNCIVADNIIKDFNKANEVGPAGIRMIGLGHVIANNRITLPDASVTNNTHGIQVIEGGITPGAGESFGVQIVGNYVSGRFPASTANFSLVYVDCTNAMVSGNTLQSTAGLAQTAVTFFKDNAVIVGNNIIGTFVQAQKAIYKWPGSTNMFVQDNRFGAVTAIHTTVASGSISGINNVDFSGLTTVVDIDNRANYDSATDSISPDLPGVYEFTAVLRVTAASASLVQGIIELNNVTVVATGLQTASAGGTVTISLAGFATLSGSDVVRLKATVSVGNYVIEPFASLSAKFVRQTNL